MICYQVIAQFAFHRHKPALVATRIKKQKAKEFLVLSRLPFGSVLKVRRFFRTKQEAKHYIAYLRRVYKNRIVPCPALPGGQQYLFQDHTK
jgi:hypothetical protein